VKKETRREAASSDDRAGQSAGSTDQSAGSTDQSVGSTDQAVDSTDQLALPRRFFSNTLWNYICYATSAATSLAVTPLLVHHLGHSAFGIWVLASSITAYLDLFQAGLDAAAIKLMAEDAYVRHERLLRTLNTAFAALIPFGILALGVGLVVSFFSPHLFRIPPGLQGQAVFVFSLLTISLAVSVPGDVIGGTLDAFQRWDLVSIANALFAIVSTGVMIGIVLNHGGLVPLASAFTAVSVSFFFVRWSMVRRIFPEARLRPRLVDRARLRSTVGLSGWFLIVDLSSTISGTSDLIVVGILFGARTAGLYAIGFKLAQVVSQLQGAFTITLFSHASATDRNKGREALKAVLADGTRIALLATFIPALALGILAYPGVRAWVGPGYRFSSEVLLVLVGGVALNSIFAPMEMVLSGAGRVRILSFIATCMAVSTVGLAIAFAHLFGPVGVAVGRLVTSVTFVPAWLVAGKLGLGFPPSRLARESLLPHVLPAVSSGGVLLLMRYTVADSIPGLVLSALAGVAVYVLVYLCVGATASERARVLQFVRRH
jgi:O-antigen/teichoic acid export membrane protein